MCAGKKHVVKLKCTVCTKFKFQLLGQRNYNEEWNKGADSIRTGNIKDHATSDKQKRAMLLQKKETRFSKGLPMMSYSTIAQALTKLSKEEHSAQSKKFDIAYFIAMKL